MDPTGEPTSATPAKEMLLSRKHLSLVLLAILLGLATAACIVLLMAMRPGVKVHAASKGQAAADGRPSPFSGASVAATAASSEVNLTTPQIAKAGNSSVVTVTGYNENDQPLGQANGYVYASSGIIVTSYSAIRGASSVEIDTVNGEELTVLALMGYSRERDLAALAVLEGNLPELPSGAEEPVHDGDASVILGANRAVTQGTVAGRRAVGGVDLMQVNAQAAAGSPMLNQHGKVIGLVVRRSTGGNSVFAIPSHYVSDLLAENHVLSFEQMLEETGQAPAPASGAVAAQ